MLKIAFLLNIVGIVFQQIQYLISWHLPQTGQNQASLNPHPHYSLLPLVHFLQTTFPYVHCIRQSDQPEEDFQPILLNTLYEKSLSPYVVFSVDDVIVKDTINFKECIETMEKVGAYGFYLAHGNHLDYCYMKNLIQEIPPYIVVEQGINAWQFNQGKNDWIHPNSLDMVIYKKADIEKDFRKIRFKNPNILEYFWNLRSKLKRVGLFYDVSRCINIPLNKVNPSTNRSMEGFSPLELLDFFEKGLKINITPLHHIQNSSKHIDFSPEFIYRKDFVTESNFEELYQSAEINLHLGRAKVLTVEQL